MGRKNVSRIIKVGVFTIVALIIITSFIFYIGSKQQAFGSKKEINITFKNVSGLKTGNAVRFAGVTIGAVEKISILTDTTILVTISIDANDSKFIKKDSKASISTEGLLGSKYIRITPGSTKAVAIESGDYLMGSEPIDFDELLTSLNESGANFKNITGSVDQIVHKINSGEGTLGAFISDPKMNEEVNKIVKTFGTTGSKATELTTKMIEAVDTLKSAGENTVKATEELRTFTKKLNNDSSTLGRLITDTTMAKNLNTTIVELQTTAADVKETSTSVRNSWVIKLFGKKNKNKK